MNMRNQILINKDDDHRHNFCVVSLKYYLKFEFRVLNFFVLSLFSFVRLRKK